MQHANSLLGYLTLTFLALLVLSGGALLWATNVEPLRRFHNVSTFALVATLGAHSLWHVIRRISRIGAENSPPLHLAWPVGLLLSVSLAALVAVPGVLWKATPLSRPSQPRIGIHHAALGKNDLPSATRCVGCHTDATAQWRSSLHAQAGTNAYYQAVTMLFIQERGVQAAQYCAACHNPVGLMRGEMDAQAGVADNAIHPDSKGYESRTLGIHLPQSDAAAEGVTCTVCHLATQAGEPPNNGNLTLQPTAADLPQAAFSRLVLRSAPEAHRGQLLPPIISESTLCGTCHNVYTETGTPLEPTYDEWLASPYPERGESCQSCHMPTVQARRADSGLVQSVSAHGSIPGALSSLPDTAQDPTLLHKAAELSLDIERGDVWQITVSVTNSGAGHMLPTGAADLRQLWLELSLRDATGQILQQIGGLDAFGMLTPETIQFRKVLGDAQGKPIELHRFWVATQILLDNRLAPLETRRIPFRLTPPRPGQGPYTIVARLLYRDVSPAFAEFALNRPLHDLPVREVVSQQVIVEMRE
ncbi:MAG: hypothetical protein KJZ86_08800 [Caldilineaceae bacterium]|nr:hypothetical protein [Caldilineaceae bacterium]HRJ42349.1 multiheme c-type cytochrome [Caldilineaceae bacterium]